MRAKKKNVFSEIRLNALHRIKVDWFYFSQIVLYFSSEGQLPEPNLFLTSRSFMSFQSLLHLFICRFICRVEAVTRFFISCTHMGCPILISCPNSLQ